MSLTSVLNLRKRFPCSILVPSVVAYVYEHISPLAMGFDRDFYF
jgi:hypothetical protein